jgi:3-hydroxyacyl-CoA dehydrogenase, NAD binding domain
MAKDPTNARIAVVGAGLMGHGIAQVFALAGHEVTITDVDAASLDTAPSRIAANLHELGEDGGAVARLRPCATLAETVRDADYVVEAVSENLPLKQKLFAEIERHARSDAILASNTSVIPITSIMQGLAGRERALGTHWWNPPYLVPLVEVIETQWTSPQAVDWTMALHRAAGKQPAHVKKDVPGFIGNRLQHALWREPSRWSSMVSAMPKRSMRSSRPRSAAGSPCSARSRMPTWSAPTSRSPSTTSCCRPSTAGPGRRLICESSWLTESSVSNPAKASANGAPVNRRRCAPS